MVGLDADGGHAGWRCSATGGRTGECVSRDADDIEADINKSKPPGNSSMFDVVVRGSVRAHGYPAVVARGP